MLSVLRHHFTNWAPFVTGLLVGVLIGLVLSSTYGQVQLDSGFAGLAGAAIGAGVTAFGAIWVAMYQAGAQERAHERFVADAVSSIRDEAYLLLQIVERAHNVGLRPYGSKLLDQAENLEEALLLFQKNVTTTVTSNYTIRLWVNRLESAVQTNLKTINKEMGWLKGTRSQSVVDNAKVDLRLASNAILEACNEAINRLNYQKELPTDEQVAERFAVLSEEK